MTDLAGAISTFGLVVFGFYVLISGGYLLIHLAALVRLRDRILGRYWKPVYDPLNDPFLPGITIVVPAYNEKSVITSSAESFLNVNYPELEVVIVNDGSTDGTLERLREHFDLEPVEAPVPVEEIPCEPVHQVYQSATVENLRVVDKENGGKGDAHNAGIWLANTELFCITDADTVMKPSCLRRLIRPFLNHPAEMVAVGSPIRVSNGATIRGGLVERAGLSDSHLANLQKVEYIRAFLSGRMGLDQLNSLLLISGAFGLFRTDVTREMGGYDSDSIVEDIEFTIRLHKHLRDRDRSYRVAYEPFPLVWTQVPEDRRTLSNQRRRWYRGLVETLSKHRDVLFKPRYGFVGLFGVPFFLFAEGAGRIVEATSYAVVPLAVLLGVFDPWHALLLTGLAMAYGVFLTWLSLFSEVWSTRQYDRSRDVAALMGYAVVEFVGYRQWRTVVSMIGLVEYLRGENDWGAMERLSLETEEA